jgi:hypothetical protein
MRKIVIFCFFVLLASFSSKEDFSNQFYIENNQTITREIDYFTIHVDFTATSAEGCTAHVVGEAGINWWRLKITSFTGTVTLGGPGNCPHMTLPFNWIAVEPQPLHLTDDMIEVTFDTDDVCNLSQITWVYSDDVTTRLLNSQDTNDGIISQIKNLCGCDIKLKTGYIKSSSLKQFSHPKKQ